jgi:hypothetical protein
VRNRIGKKVMDGRDVEKEKFFKTWLPQDYGAITEESKARIHLI